MQYPQFESSHRDSDPKKINRQKESIFLYDSSVFHGEKKTQHKIIQNSIVYFQGPLPSRSSIFPDDLGNYNYLINKFELQPLRKRN